MNERQVTAAELQEARARLRAGEIPPLKPAVAEALLNTTAAEISSDPEGVIAKLDAAADNSHAERQIAQRGGLEAGRDYEFKDNTVTINGQPVTDSIVNLGGDPLPLTPPPQTVEHTLTHEDAALINANLINGYVSAGQVFPVEVQEGRRFIWVGDERVELA